MQEVRMSTGETWTLGHRPALDGLRGVAVILVVVAHAAEGVTFELHGAGVAGVTIFFVLSGFLITSLMLEERQRNGYTDLRAFYRRRAIRLLPALLVMLLITSAVGVVSFPAIVTTLLYVANWYQAQTLALGGLGHTWSLAVEEQFYIVWPLVVIACARMPQRVLFWLALIGAGGIIVARFVLYDGTPVSAFRVSRWTHTRADGLLLGCALAVAMQGRACRRTRPWLVNCLVMGTVAASVFGNSWQVDGLPTVTGLLTVAAIYAACRGSYSGWLGYWPMRLVGSRSYSLYLWHIPALSVMAALELDGLARGAAGIAAAWLLAILSWRYVEQPCLRYKKRRSADDDGEADPRPKVGADPSAR